MREIVVRVLIAMLLITGTVIFWNREHRPLDDGTRVSLAEPSAPLSAGPEALRLPLGGFGDANGLELDWSLQARSLQRGDFDWETGRLHLEWLRDGSTIERIFLAGARDDQTSSRVPVILTPVPPGATAELHLENLGSSGSLQLVRFEARPTRHDSVSKWGLIFTGVGWLAWAASVAGSMRRFPSWLGAGLWVGAAYFLVVPGPWQLRSPLGTVDGISPPVAAKRSLTPRDFVAADITPGALESPNLLLRWKIRLQPLRPLLHGLLFFVPTLGLLVLTQNERRGLTLAALLALGVEAAQWGFGYGFEWTDGVDLATDAAGMLMALWVFRKWRKGKPGKEGHLAGAPQA